MKFIKSILFCTTLLYTSLLCAATNTITTDLDRSKIAANETAHIIFTYKGKSNQLAPDFSPLEKNFILLGTSQSTQASFINNNVSRKTQWIVTIAPNRQGTLTIPAIDFGPIKSKPSKIQVVKAKPTTNSTQNQAIYLETNVSTKKPFVQSQVIYTIRLFYRVIMNGAITEPDMPNAVVMRLGKDKKYQRRKNGELYQVLERKYAIFPQKSGKFIIKPLILTGVQNNSRYANNYDPFFMRTSGHPIRLQTKTVNLTVQPIPAAAKNKTWLPAKNITVQQSWPGISDKIRVGEPITREIIIKATGQTAAQIPAIDTENTADFNIYPDKAHTENQIDTNTIIGVRQQKFAYIPTKTGKLTLPSFTIPWWDVKKQKMQVATLPEKTVNIVPAANTLPSATPPQQQATSPQAITPPTQPALPTTTSHGLWLAMLFAALWLLTLLFFSYTHFFKKKQAPNTTHTNTHKKSLKLIRKNLKSACKTGNAHQAQHDLQQWATLQWPKQSIYTLADITNLIQDEALKGAIHQLEKTLYADDKHPWEGTILWQAVDQFQKKSKARQTSQKANPLPPLYLHE